jgi:hypothetical protein
VIYAGSARSVEVVTEMQVDPPRLIRHDRRNASRTLLNPPRTMTPLLEKSYGYPARIALG